MVKFYKCCLVSSPICYKKKKKGRREGNEDRNEKIDLLQDHLGSLEANLPLFLCTVRYSIMQYLMVNMLFRAKSWTFSQHVHQQTCEREKLDLFCDSFLCSAGLNNDWIRSENNFTYVLSIYSPIFFLLLFSPPILSNQDK